MSPDLLLVSGPPAPAEVGLGLAVRIVAVGDTPVEDVPALQRLMVGELIDPPTTVTIGLTDRLREPPLVPVELAV